MRFYLFGPRFFGIRPGISFQPSDLSALRATASRSSYVYVINGDHDHVKIGVTKNPPERLTQLQTSSSRKLAYAFIAPTSGDPYVIEREAHVMLDRYRLNGEWFDVPPELAIAAVTGAAAKLGQSLIAKPDEKPARIWPFILGIFLALWAAMFWLINSLSKITN